MKKTKHLLKKKEIDYRVEKLGSLLSLALRVPLSIMDV